MSGSDDGRGNSEEREGGPPARVLAGGQIVQPGQGDRPERDEKPEPGKFHRLEDANEYIGITRERNAELRARLETCRQQREGAVSSWPSARNVIEAVREGQLGVDALREVVTILDIHLGGQPEPSVPWPAWADHMRPGGQS